MECVHIKEIKSALYHELWKLHIINYIVHCEWKDWVFGECSKTCGGGTTINNRTEKVSAKHGGDECDGASLVEESCNIQECPGKNFVSQ